MWKQSRDDEALHVYGRDLGREWLVTIRQCTPDFIEGRLKRVAAGLCIRARGIHLSSSRGVSTSDTSIFFLFPVHLMHGGITPCSHLKRQDQFRNSGTNPKGM